MSAKDPRVIPFNGIRFRFDSTKTFDALVAALLADIGSTPVAADEIAVKFASWEAYEAELNTHVGASGFMLLALFDHGAWINKADINKKVLRVILGNPLIAISMLRHDLTAGLFVPIELVIIEEDDGHSSLTYVQPSSLMVIEPNPPLLAAARALDAKLEALAKKVTDA